MSIIDWIPPVSTTFIFALVLYLSKNLIITRLSNSVKHEYEKKIEEIRSDLRKREDILKEKIGEKLSLINNSLSSISNNHNLYQERKIIAVEKLWQAIIDLSLAKYNAQVVSKLNVKEIEKSLKTDPIKSKRYLDELTKVTNIFDIKDLPKNNIHAMRPFISPLAWALYSAYSAIIYRSCLQIEILKAGLDTKYLNDERVANLIKAVLPHQQPVLDKFGLDASYYFLEELEQMLLKELDCILSGKEYDKENLARAAIILKEAQKIMDEKTDSNQIVF